MNNNIIIIPVGLAGCLTTVALFLTVLTYMEFPIFIMKAAFACLVRSAGAATFFWHVCLSSIMFNNLSWLTSTQCLEFVCFSYIDRLPRLNALQ